MPGNNKASSCVGTCLQFNSTWYLEYQKSRQWPADGISRYVSASLQIKISMSVIFIFRGTRKGWQFGWLFYRRGNNIGTLPKSRRLRKLFDLKQLGKIFGNLVGGWMYKFFCSVLATSPLWIFKIARVRESAHLAATTIFFVLGGIRRHATSMRYSGRI
jgi:hypothetical protein